MNAYLQISEISRDIGIKHEPDITNLLSLPNCVKVEPLKIDEQELWKELSAIINRALDKCCSFRLREGKALKKQINASLKVLRQHRNEIDKLKHTVVENYRQRLRRRVAQVVKSEDVTINGERVEAEVLFFADKSDISEELTRLKSHFTGFKKYLADSYEGQVGKALDFLSQELLREVNTIASKARDTQVAQRVLIMKNEVEKIREQVQNIE
jgi:uncharacterized protein (TIGR00255 family)